MNLDLLQNTFFENIQSKKESFHKHSHDTYTIGVTHDGVFRSINSNKAFYSYKNSSRIINPGEIHGGDSNHWRYTNFYPSVDLLCEIYHQIFFEKKIPVFQNHIIEDIKLYKLLSKLFKSIYSNKDAMEIEIYLIDALSYLIKEYTFTTKNHKNMFDDKLVVKSSIEFIHDSIESNITLEELSKNVNMSKYHFLRVFKKQIGTTPHNYIVMQKVQNATRKIMTGTSIAEASFSSGFSDQSHFTRNFKKIYGYTPSKVLDTQNILLYR